MSNTPVYFHHLGISVADLDASIEWYRDKLGFVLENRHPIPAIPAEVAFVANGDLRVEMFCVPDAVALPPDRRIPNDDLRTHGNKHIALAVADVMALAADFEARGIDIVWAKRFEFGAAMFIRDNSGNLIEFIEYPAPTGQATRV
jgi:catechol 2,3-dioxygenase-like lactoylglutathione lyase family enzyme